MPTKLQDIEGRFAALATKSHEIANDDRDWSEKAAEWEGVEADIKAMTPELEGLRASEKNLGLVPPVDDEGNQPGPAPAAVTAKSIGEQVTESDAFKALDAKSGIFQTPQIDVKATFTVAGGGAGLIVPQYQPGVTEILLKKLTVADLLASGSIAGNTLIYLKESSITNAAAAVAEGGAKPGSDLNTAQVTETLKKVATTLKVSDEMLLDSPLTASYINGRLVVFVQQAEESQLLNGSGSGANMTGLLNRSGLSTAVAVGSDTQVDAIFKQITAIRTAAFIEPDGLVINPSDWQSIRLAKDDNGQYYGGGPFTGAYGNGQASTDSLWGLPVVVTPAIAQGTALVGAFKTAAQRFVQGGIRVDMTNSNEDDFLNNLVTMRAEIRELLAVYRPAGFGKVTGLT